MLGTIVVIIVGLAACGSGSSSEIVAQINGVASITKATLNHWIPVEAAVLYQEIPTGPVPKGVLPDPPNYTACITYLASAGQKLVENSPKPTAAELKSKCEQQLHDLTVLTLNTLIDWNWTLGAGKALGINVTDAEAKRRLTEVNGRLFPHTGEFRKYREATGQTITDMLFRAKVQLFEIKEKERLTIAEKRLPTGPPAQRQAALRELIAGLPPSKQWAARTSCRKGFITSACKQYKGSQTPGYPN